MKKSLVLALLTLLFCAVGFGQEQPKAKAENDTLTVKTDDFTVTIKTDAGLDTELTVLAKNVSAKLQEKIKSPGAIKCNTYIRISRMVDAKTKKPKDGLDVWVDNGDKLLIHSVFNLPSALFNEKERTDGINNAVARIGFSCPPPKPEPKK